VFKFVFLKKNDTRQSSSGASNRKNALTAVVSSFVRGRPGDGGEGALEEGVVDDIALVVFAFDDPVAGEGFTMSGVGEDGGGLGTLRGIYKKRSAGAKSVHFSSPGGAVMPTRSMIPLRT
jgi:hypothetical protein